MGRSKAVDAVEKARVAGKNILVEDPELAVVYKALATSPELEAELGGRTLDPQAVEFGSMIYAVKPGDGSAREQAASCQRVIGGLANIVREYATKRYRSNVMNWGMLPFQLEGEPPFEVGDYVFVPGARAALDGDLSRVDAYVVRLRAGDEGIRAAEVEKTRLYAADMTREERAIVKAGCLINYNREKLRLG